METTNIGIKLNVTRVTKTKGLMRVLVDADHRNGICIKCGIQMEVKEVEIEPGKMRNRPVCPQCGGMIGQLITHTIHIDPLELPQCISLKCLGKYLRDSLFLALLASYHHRRVAYAERNRPEKGKIILERYRTGDPSPKTIWQAIHANIKLSCPLCRRYNVDPLLGR